MKNLFDLYKSLKKSNKGSGIVTVLIAVMFLTVTGTLVMMLSYTNIEMKVAENKGRQAAYDASMAMDEVKLGFQQVLSDSINNSYTDTLKFYMDKSKPQEAIKTNIKNWFPTPETDGNSASEYSTFIEGLSESEKTLVTAWTEKGDGTFEGIWNESMVRYMVKTLPLSSSDHDRVKILTDESKRKVVATDTDITFKNISIQYTDEEGRKSKVTADIKITYYVPDFSVSQYSMYGIPSFSIISGGSFTQTSNEVTLNGNAFAESMDLGGSTAKLQFNGDTLVVKNDVTVSGVSVSPYNALDASGKSIVYFPDTTQGYIDEYTHIVDCSRFIVNENSTFWTNSINVKQDGYVSLLGTAFVGDDLELMGTGASVALANSYTGFGTSTDNSSTSSSIISNARNTVLNVRNLNELKLAGYSFIDASGTGIPGGSGYDTRMGESASVKENQKAYLVPKEYLNIGLYTPSTNPDVLTRKECLDYGVMVTDGTGAEAETLSLVMNPSLSDGSFFDKETKLWSIAEEDYTFASYNARCVPKCYPVGATGSGDGEQYIIYYLIEFDDEVDASGNVLKSSTQFANEYFRDYVTAHHDEIDSYIKNYVKLGSTSATIRTVGNNFFGVDYLDPNSALIVKSEADSCASRFASLCSTLTYDKLSSDSTPFTYYIDSAKLADKCNTAPVYFYTYDKAGNRTSDIPVAVCTNSAYTFDGGTHDGVDTSGIKFIICGSTVTVNTDFDGLIICGGNLVVNSNVTFNPNSAEVGDAYLHGKSDSGLTPKEFFLHAIDDMINEGTPAEGELSTYISYSKWKKN